ncbi:MAG TPA: hypothetical protein VJH03_02030 [Blastocatellia bacterium]|nr:hypothetical protein [Blastocatellia bacterium]
MFEYHESEYAGGEFEIQEGPFSEAEEMELAAELLGVTSEAELDHFLGKVFKRVGGFVKKVAASPLGGILKSVAKKALPFVGGALGSFIPIPGVGTMVGKALGTAASGLLEAEGLSEEDREFEAARQFVRLAGAAAQNLAATPAGASPIAAAKSAFTAAARQHAPALVGAATAGGAKTGRWVRKGPRIVLYGV